MMRMHFHYARPGGMLLAMVIATLDRNTRKVSQERAHGQRPPLSPQFKPGRFSAKRGAIELRDVVVYVDGRADNTGTLEFAAALAFEHGAHLIGVFIQPELALSRAEMFVRGKGIEDVVVAHQGKLSGIETDRRALFESVARRHGIRAEWRLVPSADSSESAVHARYGDLAVVARQDPGDRQVGLPGLVESLVLTSGRPTIVLPPRCAATPIRRILVGWNAGREATRAVADALPLLVRADVARHLARHGVRVEVRRLSSGGKDVGRLLLSRAAALSADLIVIGAYGHSHLSEWIFGGVTRTALREAELPVLISR